MTTEAKNTCLWCSEEEDFDRSDYEYEVINNVIYFICSKDCAERVRRVVSGNWFYIRKSPKPIIIQSLATNRAEITHSKTCAVASQELADAYEALKLSPTPANAKEVAYLAVHFANVHATECEE